MIEIFITTAKRGSWCLNLLHDLKEQGKGYEFNVRVIHDKSDSDYSGVIKFCEENKNFYYGETEKTFGKIGFWYVNNMMYQLLDTLKYDYFIQLPDDIILVDNFFKRVLNLVKSEIDLCNFFTFNIHKQSFLNTQIQNINNVEMWQNNWVDCCFIAKPSVMKGFQIEETNPNRWLKRKYTGSGVAGSFIREYNRRYDKQIYQTCYSLVEHIGAFKTAMHDYERSMAYYNEPQLEIFEYKKNMGNKLLMNLHDSDKDYIENKINSLQKEGKI